MTQNYKAVTLIILVLATIVGTCLLPRLTQDLSFHNFADNRSMFGISNFLNVISNFLFLLLGGWALVFTLSEKKSRIFIHSTERISWLILFAGVFLIGVGSSYYHLAPGNDRLVWDRLPMTIVFMSFTSILISVRINHGLGFILLWMLNLLGIFSVWYWQHTEETGLGDLRIYAFVQFAPMIFIPVLLTLYRSGQRLFREIVFIFLFYALAKAAEHFDKEIYYSTGFLSGHTLKHLLASGSVFFMFRIMKNKFSASR